MAIGTVIKHPKWKLALWARDSIEPALLRVPIVILLFLALWGINIWILDKFKLQYSPVLSVRTVSVSFVIISALSLLALYALDITILSTTMGLSIEYGVFTFYVIFLISHFVPIMPGIENRTAFYRLFRTIIFPGNVITFPEILIADACTSLSKVFKDFGISLFAIYAYFTEQNILEYHNSSMIMVALFASWPFWIRVRQCLIQLDSCPDTIAKIPVYLNILKYISAFPPIWLTAAASLGYQHPHFAEYIMVAAIINSTYSFLWDVIMDWGLMTITREGKILRRQRTYYPIPFYILAVILNLCLRFSWTMNRLPRMHMLHSSIIVLVIELGEIVRRAIWNLFRIEWEIIVQQEKGVLFEK